MRLLDSPYRLRQGVLIAGVVLSTLPGLAAPAAEEPAPECIYWRFDVPPGDTPTLFSIALRAGDWHVGHPAGALADEGRMHWQLGRLGQLSIGGHCVGERDGDTYRACAFALSEPALAEGRPDSGLRQWRATSGTSLMTMEADSDTGVATVFSSPEDSPGLGLPGDFVGLQASAGFLRSVRDGYGATLSFRLQQHLNPLAVAKAGTAAGLVALCTGTGPASQDDVVDLGPMRRQPASLLRPATDVAL